MLCSLGRPIVGGTGTGVPGSPGAPAGRGARCCGQDKDIKFGDKRRACEVRSGGNEQALFVLMTLPQPLISSSRLVTKTKMGGSSWSCRDKWAGGARDSEVTRRLGRGEQTGVLKILNRISGEDELWGKQESVLRVKEELLC